MRDCIFVSYRKEDTKDAAGRLADRLKHHFSEQRVFLDTADIAVGDAWLPTIIGALARSAVVIVLIGERWIDARDAKGRRRLDDPDDVVRREIECALGSGAAVIAVTVHGAKMPTAEQLPASIRRLVAIQGDSIRAEHLLHQTFRDDVDRLVRNTSRLIDSARGARRATWRTLQPQRRHGRLMEVVRGLLTNPYVPPRMTRRLMQDTFLRQDPNQDIRDYAAERPVTRYLPYVEIKNWCAEIAAGREPRIDVRMLDGEFELASWGAGDGDAIRDEALKVALHEKPKTFDGPAVRISSAHATDASLFLTSQRARYFAQRRSNLALDFRYERSGGSIITLRDLLRQQYGAHLPPLDDARMANTLGVAVLIMIREGADLTPYLVSRSRDVAVFNAGGEWHCTASGVAEVVYNDREDLFHIDSIEKELDEEVGLLRHDLEFLAPVAFCREMTRAGKPQMFFLGVTSLDRDTLIRKLKAARKRAKDAGDVVENTARPLLRQPSDLTDGEALALYHDKGFTIEAAATLHYLLQCRALA